MPELGSEFWVCDYRTSFVDRGPGSRMWGARTSLVVEVKATAPRDDALLTLLTVVSTEVVLCMLSPPDATPLMSLPPDVTPLMSLSRNVTPPSLEVTPLSRDVTAVPLDVTLVRLSAEGVRQLVTDEIISWICDVGIEALRESHMETLTICKCGPMKFPTQND